MDKLETNYEKKQNADYNLSNTEVTLRISDIKEIFELELCEYFIAEKVLKFEESKRRVKQFIKDNILKQSTKDTKEHHSSIDYLINTLGCSGLFKICPSYVLEEALQDYEKDENGNIIFHEKENHDIHKEIKKCLI